MFRFIIQLAFFMSVVLGLFAVFSFLMPVLTHPIASMIFIALFVLFAVKAYEGSQR
jgi:succinate-acetate transporter protein